MVMVKLSQIKEERVAVFLLLFFVFVPWAASVDENKTITIYSQKGDEFKEKSLQLPKFEQNAEGRKEKKSKATRKDTRKQGKKQSKEKEDKKRSIQR